MRLTWWLFWATIFGTFRRSQNRRLNLGATVGFWLRILILVADFGMLFALIPLRIPVHENDVGSSGITFEAGTVTSRRGRQGWATCMKDNVRYSGISPLVLRHVCISTRPENCSSPALDILRSFPNESDIYYFRDMPDQDSLGVYSARDHVNYVFSHQIVNISGEYNPLNLPMPDDIANRFMHRIVRKPRKVWNEDLQNFSKICTPAHIPLVADSELELRCIAYGTDSIKAFNFMMSRIILSTRPKPAIPIEQLVGSTNRSAGVEYVQVGLILRPRLCITPALILLAYLGTTYIFVNKVLGDGDILSHILTLLQKDANIVIAGNPRSIEVMHVKDISICTTLFCLRGRRF